jgi:hypothetical protein
MLGLAGVCSYAQTRVDGQVQNGDRFHPVAGTTVQLVNAAIKFVQTTKTDDDGNFEFPVVPPQAGYVIQVLDANGKILVTSDPFDLNVGQAHTTLPPIDISAALTPPPPPPTAPVTAPAVPSTSNSAPQPVLATKPPPQPLPAQSKSHAIQNDLNTALSANITRTQLSEIPLFNRNFLALGLFLPGVHDIDPGSPLAGAAFSISGSRTTSSNFQLDGSDNLASSTNQAIPFQVNDSVQEFRIVYANPDLRYGQGSGGVVDVVTNRGQSKGSAWHGTLFGYFNNDALNANNHLSIYSGTTFAKAAAYAGSTTGSPDEIANEQIGNAGAGYISYAPTTYNALYRLLTSLTPQTGQQAGLANCRAAAGSICTSGMFDGNAVLSQNDSRTQPFDSKQFGGNIGGPLGKELFLFGSYEGTLIDNPNPIFERVPTASDLSTNGLGLNANDSAIATSVLSLYPKPNVQGTNTGTFGFYKGTAPNYTHVHNLLVRPDIDLGRKGQLSIRYAGQLLDQLHDDSLPANSPSGYPGNGADRRAQNQSVTLVHTLAFGNGKSVNEARLGFTQYRVDEVAQDHNFSSPAVPGSQVETFVLSGIDNRLAGATPGTPGAVGGWYDSFWNQLPGNTTYSPSPVTPSLDGDFPFARIGAPLSAPAAHRDSQAQAADTFTFPLGSRHRLTIGGEYRYIQNFDFEGGMARGIVVSNNIGEFTSDSESCISCGNGFVHPSFDYELKQPNGYVGDLRSYVATGFIEDKFQPKPRLTITAGLRYNFFGQPWDTNNRLWNYSQDANGLVHQGATGTYDAFAYQCAPEGSSTETHLDSLYGARRITFNSGWTCNPNAKFSLPADKKNFAPRVGFSYALDSDYRNVIRGAFGMYYDHLPASYTEQLLINRPSPYNVNSPSAIYGQNFYSAGCPGATNGGQCGFGLSTLNPTNLSPDQQATFDSYQAASGAGPIFERDTKHLHNPYTLQFHVDFQHQFARSWTSEVSYIGMLGRRLPLIYDGNFLQEFYCTSSGTTTQPGGLCNNNTFFPVFTESNFGSSNYHSLILQVRSETWHGLLLNAAYTFSKSMDNIAGSNFPRTTDALWNQIFGRQLYGLGNPTAFALGANPLGVGGEGGRGGQLQPGNCNQNPDCLYHAILAEATIPSFDAISSALTTTGSRPVIVTEYNLPQDPLHFSSDDYGRSDFNVAHRVVVDFVYDLPTWGHAFLNGISLSGVFSAQTGLPYTIFSGPAYGQITQRVNITGNVRTTGKPGQYFANLSQFTTAAVADRATNSCPNLYATPSLYSGSAGMACVGTSHRNPYSGPAFISQDFAAQKRFHLFSERGAMILRAEFFNLFDRANYYNPITEFSTDGVHLNPEFGIIRSAHDPRQIQLAARFDF